MNELRGQAYHVEAERRANDECLVINPTDTDYVVKYGNDSTPGSQRIFVIPNQNKDIGYGKGKRIVPRFIARNYIKHMTNKLINEEYDKKMVPEKAKFDKRGEWFGQKEIQIAPKTNDQKLRDSFFPILWGGVVREFGKDEIPEETPNSNLDRRSYEDRMMDSSPTTPNDFISQIEETNDTTQQTS